MIRLDSSFILSVRNGAGLLVIIPLPRRVPISTCSAWIESFQSRLSKVSYVKYFLGWELTFTVSYGKSGKPCVKFRFTKKDSIKFFEYVSGLVELKCFINKLPAPYQHLEHAKCPPLKKVLKQNGLQVRVRPYTENEILSRGTHVTKFRRYNIEVADNHNYTLPGGLITKNCSKSALTSLLKVLEEGVPNTLFVFATTEELLKTIRSRSTFIEISTLPQHLIINHVKGIAASEGIEITDEQLTRLARKSAGHMRDAVALLEHFRLAGEDALLTSYTALQEYFLTCLRRQPVNDAIQKLLLFPIIDINMSLSEFLLNSFKSIGAFESKINSKGLHRQMFKFFYQPEVQHALKDEDGLQLVLLAFAEQFK